MIKKAACHGADTREVRMCGATFEECRLCERRVRWDMVNHWFFGFKNCNVGQKIETTMSDGQKVVMSLDTPEAAAYANELIASGRWKKVPQEQT